MLVLALILCCVLDIPIISYVIIYSFPLSLSILILLLILSCMIELANTSGPKLIVVELIGICFVPYIGGNTFSGSLYIHRIMERCTNLWSF